MKYNLIVIITWVVILLDLAFAVFHFVQHRVTVWSTLALLFVAFVVYLFPKVYAPDKNK